MGWLDNPVVQPEDWLNNEVVMGPGPANMPPINPNREVSAGPRMIAGLKSGPEGVARYLEQRFGRENIATDKDGSFYVKDKGEFIPFDSSKLNALDAYDASGLAVAAAPVIGGEVAAARIAPTLLKAAVRGAGLGGAGSITQQAAGLASPGGDPVEPGARLTQLGLDMAGGVVGEGLSRGISRGISGVRNQYAKQTGQADTAITQEGERISQELGVPLTPGQRSQRTSLLTLEGALRRSPTRAADIMQGLDERQLLAARKRWDDLTNQVSRNPATAEALGGQIIKAFDATADTAFKVLEANASRDFAVIDTAAGKAPIFTMGNTAKALDDIIGRYDVEGAATDTTKGLVRQLKSARDAFNQPKSALEMQRLLASYGRATRGKNTLFGELDKRENMGIAKHVFGALNADLDAVVQAGTGPAAAALKTARDNYRQNFAVVDELRKSTVGKYLGLQEADTVAPEAVANRLTNMHPTQMRQTFKLLDNADPELAGTAKRYMLEQAMVAAKPSAEQIAERVGAGVTPEAYSPGKLIGNLKTSPVLDVLDRNEKFAVERLSSAMQRLGNRGGTEGSPTSPLMWATDIIQNFVRAGIALDAMAALKVTAATFAPTKIAEAIASPKHLNALMTLTQPNLSREATLSALGIVGGLATTRPAEGEDVRPFAIPAIGQTSLSP